MRSFVKQYWQRGLAGSILFLTGFFSCWIAQPAGDVAPESGSSLTFSPHSTTLQNVKSFQQRVISTANAPGPQGAQGVAGIPLPRYATGSLPAPGSSGSMYLTTDTLKTPYYDNGSLVFAINGNTINALTYGADATGVADSTTAINNAISAASTGGIPYVQLPPGNYKISPNPGGVKMLSNVGLIGAGRGLTNVFVNVTGQGQVGIEIDGSSSVKNNISIRGISLYSANAAYSSNTVLQTGIYLVDAASGIANSDIAVEDCEIYYCALVGIGGTGNGAGVQRFHVRRCYFHDIGTSTMGLASNQIVSGIQGLAGSEINYVDNDFYNVGTHSTDWGIYQSRPVKGIQIALNRVNNCAGGIQIGTLLTAVSSKAIISSNVVRGCTAAPGISLESTFNAVIANNAIEVASSAPAQQAAIVIQGSNGQQGVSVFGNTIDLNGQNIGTGAINALSTQSDLFIAHNVIRNGLAGTGSTIGIYVQPGTGGSVRGVKISDNFIDGVVFGIKVGEVDQSPATQSIAMTDSEITNNTVYNSGICLQIWGTQRLSVVGNTLTPAAAGTAGIQIKDGFGTQSPGAMVRGVVRDNRISNILGGPDLLSFAGNGCTFKNNFTSSQPTATAGATNTANAVVDNFSLTIAAGTWPVAQLTSGATPSLGSWTLGSETVQMSYTGATNVTAFTGGFADERRQLNFTNGNVTLVNSTGLQLKGAANVNPASGNVMYFYFDGTNWIETGRNF